MKSHLRLLPVYALAILLAASLTPAQDAKKDKTTQENKKGKKDNKSGKPADDYYPLQVGNQWHYLVEVGGISGKAVSKIIRMDASDGTARLEASLNGKEIASENLRSTDKGVFRYRNNNQEISPPICLLKYPVKTGEKWNGDISVGKEKGNYFCEVKEEPVEVPAGKYKAMKVTVTLESKGQKVNTAYWFVKNVGFVKQVVEAGDLNITMGLEKFDRATETPK